MSCLSSRLTAAILAACFGAPAAATVVVSDLVPDLFVDVAASVTSSNGFQYAYDSGGAQGARTIYGNALASGVGANAGVAPGGTWPVPCATPQCGLSITSLHARGQSEVNGDLGRLRTHTYIQAGQGFGAASAEASIRDVVNFAPIGLQYINGPQLKLHIDGHGWANTQRGYASMDFTVRLGRHVCDLDLAPDGCHAPAFTFHAQEYDNPDITGWYYGLGDGSVRLGEGRHLPDGGLDIVVDLLEFGAQPAWDTEYDLAITLRTSVQCSELSSGDSDLGCNALFDASNTVYAGIGGIGSSTFTYPGRITDNPPGQLPTPASLPLVLAGIGLGVVGRTRRRGSAEGPA